MNEYIILSAAAKAANVRPHDVECTWNPLTNDGDCARLEAECCTDIIWGETHVTAYTPNQQTSATDYFENHCYDKNATRRYVSTLAVAERQMALEMLKDAESVKGE